MNDTVHSITLGLPVTLTYNATTGHWSVEVDLVEADDELAADGDTPIATAWFETLAADLVPVATGTVRFVPAG